MRETTVIGKYRYSKVDDMQPKIPPPWSFYRYIRGSLLPPRSFLATTEEQKIIKNLYVD